VPSGYWFLGPEIALKSSFLATSVHQNRVGPPVRLKLFNTISMRKERFESILPARVKMFVCGPTIQDRIHAGQARTYIFYDVLARYLGYLGYRVDLILNITDIDESVVKGAKKKGSTVENFLERNENAFLRDMKNLRINTVGSFERVSKYVSVMVQQASALLRKGLAYKIGGTVYFDVNKFRDFGQLSHQSRDELYLRPLEISPKKRSQIDFSLWRATGVDEQRWESPWGLGTPGWHIQDTAVSIANFGPQYDIHGGARELIYPHHEAEIAQAEALTGLKPFVRYWVHTGLLTTDGGKKMSKSDGNVYYVRDLLRKHDVNAIRLYFAGLSHRRDAEFEEGSIERMEEKYWDWKSRVRSFGQRVAKGGANEKRGLEPFLAALDDDLDGSRAIKVLSSVVAKANEERDPRLLARLFAAIASASQILGIGLVD